MTDRVGDAAAVQVRAIEHPEVLLVEVAAHGEAREGEGALLRAARERLQQRVHLFGV